MADGGRVAVLGATGYTGALVCDEIRALGLPLRLLGRDEPALRAATRGHDEIAVADATDHGSLVAALAGASCLVSTAGPFLAKGFAPVDAAVEAGAHYVDSCTEQAYSRQIFERFGSRAQEAGVALLTAFANASGDLAAAIAAERLGPIDEVVVANHQSAFSFSRGSRATLAEVLKQPHVAWDGGRLVPTRFGATTRRVRFPDGEAAVVEWPGPEPLTVPRHADVQSVRSYVRAPRIAGPAGRLAPRVAGLVRLSARVGRGGPPPAKRQKARFTVVAEARGSAGSRRATLLGRDVYGSTAVLLARAAEALVAGEAQGVGALAPAEAFEASAFLDRLAPHVQLESVVDL